MYIDQLLALAPDDTQMLMMAAENRLRLQDPDGATHYFDRVEQIRPGTDEARIGRGWIAAMRGDEAGAARLWAPVVEATEDVSTLRRMGVAFARTGDMGRLAIVRARLEQMGMVR
jgi:hypothetical protein